jgi:type I restriction enzyme S subunit
MNEDYLRWHQLKWGDIATLEYGKGLRGYQEAIAKYPVYGTNGLIGWHDSALCKKPGIIIGRKGAYRGVHLSKTPFFVIDTAFYLNLLSDNVDLIWAYYHLINFDINKIDSGSAIPSTSREAFYQIPVSLPPLTTQRKISAILSAYDDLIENNTRRIAILEEMAQALYREWFVHFRFPGYEKKSMVESVLGMIPEGWEVVSFTQIVDVLSGGTPKTTISEYWNGEIPFFTPKDASVSFYVTETERSITERGLKSCSSRLYPKDSVFITARGTVGKVVLNSMNMAMSQSSYALRGRDELDQFFTFLLTRNCIDQLRQNSHGAVFDTIIVDTFVRLKVVKPPTVMVKRFSSKVEPIFGEILNLFSKNVNLRRTRDLLLPKLISGEVDVEGLEIAGAEETEEVETKAVEV